ncbi:MAG: ATP-binding protein, partial [bacterium]|nr:ATP-binding protein [bacterium]
PGWEWYIQQLQELRPTWCVMKNKIDGDVMKIQTLELPPAHEIIDDDAKVYAKAVSQAKIGEKYLRPRKEVEEAYQKRRAELFKRMEIESFREVKKTEEVNYEEIIKGGENDGVEFKESLRWGYENGEVSKSLEHVVAKAVSAFMNAEGGTLFIGVKDDGEIRGIEKDYATFNHKNKDGFLLQLTQVINKYIGKEFHQYANIKIVPIGGKDICAVSVSKSKMPVYLKNGDTTEFYIRASASSQPMNMREANEYIKTHFSKMESLTY